MENFSSGAKKLVDEIQKSWQSDAMTNKVVCSEDSLIHFPTQFKLSWKQSLQFTANHLTYSYKNEWY